MPSRRRVLSTRRSSARLLEQLPVRVARVVRLRSEGLSAQEVGDLLGMTANAVRVMQHRGIARLRTLAEACPDARERFADRLVATAA